METKKSFTLIELLVVIALIALITSFVLVSTRTPREKAKIAKLLEFSQTIQNAIGAEAVGIWNFDEGSGTTANDVSGYRNNGTFSSPAPSWTNDTPHQIAGVGSGKYALSFDGVDDYVEILVPANNPLNFHNGDFTLSGWFKITQPSSKGCSMLGNYPHAGNPGDLVFGVSDAVSDIFLAHQNTSGQSWGVYYNFTRYFSKMTHIAWVKSGNELKLFLNGVNVTNWSIPIAFDVDYYGNKFWIGAGDWCPAPYYGTPAGPTIIDEVHIYSQALSTG